MTTIEYHHRINESHFGHPAFIISSGTGAGAA